MNGLTAYMTHACRGFVKHTRSHFLCRSYATHRDPVNTTSLLSQALDQKQRAKRAQDSVGPFYLGLTPSSRNADKKWSELSAGGKVLRTTARTSNLVVIVFGAGLSAVLIYALTSELFSKNSPTVLYGRACEQIKTSQRVARYFQGPLTFHNNPPSSLRPRHRNHQITSQLVVDASGREHMLLHFYVKGSSKHPEPASEDESFVDSSLKWTKDQANMLSEMTLDECVQFVAERGDRALQAAKRVFHFLSGDPLPSHPQSRPPLLERKEVKADAKWTDGFTGLFSGLKGATKQPTEGLLDNSDNDWSEGEVHVDLVMNDQGYYTFRYILIDMPDSHAYNSRRIFVERAPGVREGEPVIQWHT